MQTECARQYAGQRINDALTVWGRIPRERSAAVLRFVEEKRQAINPKKMRKHFSDCYVGELKKQKKEFQFAE